MAHIVQDRVKVTSISTGTGPMTLLDAVQGFDAFSAVCANNDTMFYCIKLGAQWEVGKGTWTSDNLLYRNISVLNSSNADALVDFASGSKEVFIVDPAFMHAAMTGDVTKPVDSNVTAIGANVISNAKLAKMAALTLKGNFTGALADAQDGNAFAVRTLLDVLPKIVSVSALRALTGAFLDTAVNLLAFYSGGLTGGGPLIYDAADVVTADNGVTVFVDAAGKRWKRALAGAPSLDMAGAIGDGATDNQAQFTACDALGVPVYVPAGIYRLDTYEPTGRYFGEGEILYFGETPNIKLAATPHQINTNVTGDPGGDPDDEGDVAVNRQLNFALGPGVPASFPATAHNNSLFGPLAGANQNGGSRNTFMGGEAGEYNVDGYANVAIGGSAMSRSRYGDRQTAVGSNAMKWAGSDDPVGTLHDFFRQSWRDANTNMVTRNPLVYTDIIGPVTGPSLQVAAADADCDKNVAVGRDALIHIINGEYNVAMGYKAHRNAWNAIGNVAIGRFALSDGLLVQDCIAIGEAAMSDNQKGKFNIAIGVRAMNQLTFLDANVAVGWRAGYSYDGGSTTEATAKAAAANAVFVGYQAGEYMQKGLGNVALGMNALRGDTVSFGTNDFNVAIGQSALVVITTGDRNVAVGRQAGSTITTGGKNALLGQSSGAEITTGSYNIMLGNGAGTGLGNTTSLFIVESNGQRLLHGDIAASQLGIGTAPSSHTLNLVTNLAVAGVRVVDARKTGWSTPAGTATRTSFDTATVTLENLAQRVKALIDDLHSSAGHGLIGA